MSELTHFSLFSGIGANDIAAEWAGFKTVGQCEWADFPTKVLEKHWPDVPRWRDIHDLTGESIRREGITNITVLSGGSLASLTALQESVRHLLTNVICGQSTGESFAKLLPSGSWARMSQDCFQASMDGSLEEYSETWPSWGMMLDGVAYARLGLEPCIDEREFSLLPTPTASDGAAWIKVNKTNVTESIRKCLWEPKPGRGLMQNRLTYFMQVQGYSCTEAASLYETMMGFPKDWTDLNP